MLKIQFVIDIETNQRTYQFKTFSGFIKYKLQEKSTIKQ